MQVQTGSSATTKKDADGAAYVLQRAFDLGVPVRHFPKHDLNVLSGQRPHQGFVLRASSLGTQQLQGDALPPESFTSLRGKRWVGELALRVLHVLHVRRVLHLLNTNPFPPSPFPLHLHRYPVVLALDEVWDPMNLGALLRSAHFLGADGVVLCNKNSAPLSPIVCKASSGAMEVMSIYGVDNMMRFLDASVASGWNVVGTALSNQAVEMGAVAVHGPTILVLGNEGHGLRTNVLRRCTQLVKIMGAGAVTEAEAEALPSPSPAAAAAEAGTAGAVVGEGGVDSLNVSVTGGILMHHLISSARL